MQIFLIAGNLPAADKLTNSQQKDSKKKIYKKKNQIKATLCKKIVCVYVSWSVSGSGLLHRFVYHTQNTICAPNDCGYTFSSNMI